MAALAGRGDGHEGGVPPAPILGGQHAGHLLHDEAEHALAAEAAAHAVERRFGDDVVAVESAD